MSVAFGPLTPLVELPNDAGIYLNEYQRDKQQYVLLKAHTGTRSPNGASEVFIFMYNFRDDAWDDVTDRRGRIPDAYYEARNGRTDQELPTDYRPVIDSWRGINENAGLRLLGHFHRTAEASDALLRMRASTPTGLGRKRTRPTPDWQTQHESQATLAHQGRLT